MKSLTVVAVFAFLSLIARPARAQCCGAGEVLRGVSCPNNCGKMTLTTCDEGADTTFYALIDVQCGSGGACGSVQEYAPAGQCFNGVVVSRSGPVSAPWNDKTDEGAIYVGCIC